MALAGVWGRAMDAPAQHLQHDYGDEKINKYIPSAPLRRATSFDFSYRHVVQRHGGIGIPPVVVCGTIDDSNFINRGLCLAGFTHEIASLGWVDDIMCRHLEA